MSESWNENRTAGQQVHISFKMGMFIARDNKKTWITFGIPTPGKRSKHRVTEWLLASMYTIFIFLVLEWN